MKEQSLMNMAPSAKRPTTIAAASSRFYNDNTSLLNSGIIRSTMWSNKGKHMLRVVSSFRRRLQMCIIKCWNSSPSLPQRVLNYSLVTRYERPFWVDYRATQKVVEEESNKKHEENACLIEAHARHMEAQA
ncbi:NBS-LRR type resistance protein [Cucumis melo var. makuwa]|uniref:NBS-LRR type resistance protein n=1 Tax=Cucumis melo var. makuwa TaxID=1194695 RepID=A0A5D3DAD7_CUCMM|nr:NBS-LRR type resistance protein [Cucumis melo var. makuwa]